MKLLQELIAKTVSATSPDDWDESAMGDKNSKWETALRKQQPGADNVATYDHKGTKLQVNLDDPGIKEVIKETYKLLPAAAIEVHPGVFIGNVKAVKSLELLLSLGVTHVVNTAEGSGEANVNLDLQLLEENGISYLGCRCDDADRADIGRYFKETADFIDAALAGGGKVVVNCWGGRSRSSTITLAFLLQKTELTLEEAVRKVKAVRAISPNVGFLTALVQLERELECRKTNVDK